MEGREREDEKGGEVRRKRGDGRGWVRNSG